MAKRTRTFKMQLYGVPLIVTFSRKYAARLDESIARCHAGAVGLIEGEDFEGAFLFIDPEHYSANTLAHEALHAAWRVLDIVGVEASSDNHEALAYLTGHISEVVNTMYKPEWHEQAE